LCPYCTTPQAGYNAEQQPMAVRHVRPPASVPEEYRSAPAANYIQPTAPRASEPLEFVEGDEY